MNRLSKQLVAALVGIGGFCGSIGDLYACPGGGRSFGGGIYRPRPIVYSQPRPVQYQHQVSLPPGGLNPQFPQHPGSLAPTNQLPPTVRRLGSTGTSQQQFVGQQSVARQQQLGGQQQFAGQGQVGFQQGQQQQLQAGGGGQFQGQPQGGQRQVSLPQGGQRQLAGGNAQMSALQALGGDEGQPAPQQMARRTQVARPQIDSVQQQPAEAPMSEVQQSALEALGGTGEEVASNVGDEEAFGAEQPVEQSQLTPSSSGHVGQWKATMEGGATVELTLQADGLFSWVANSNGKTSSFQGNYTIEGGSLTLVRSSDNQKLAGSLTPLGNGGMNFKLNGGKDAGLNFMRS